MTTRQLPNLLACPYCNELPTYSDYINGQINGIYCSYCPLSVEDSEMSLEQLAKVWNELPRNPDRRIGGYEIDSPTVTATHSPFYVDT